MRSKSVGDALDHIRHNIHLARHFVEGIDYPAFKENTLVFYGVTRCLEIISEASRRLPPDMKAGHPEIPWIEMAGAGNVYRHDYEDVDRHLVWGTIFERFPALLVMVESEIAKLDAASERQPKA